MDHGRRYWCWDINVEYLKTFKPYRISDLQIQIICFHWINYNLQHKSNRKFGKLLFNSYSCTFWIKKVRCSKHFDPLCKFPFRVHVKTFHVEMVEAVDHCTGKTVMYATVVKVSQEIIVIQKVKNIITFLIFLEVYKWLHFQCELCRVSGCCIHFPHELTCQIWTNQSIKLERKAWAMRDQVVLNNWLNFRARSQFEIKIVIVRGHSDINNIFHMNLKKLSLRSFEN